MSECVDHHLAGAQGSSCPATSSTAANDSTVSPIDSNFIEKLRVYKQVCQKVRSSLVAGRDEIVSPTTFMESLVECNSSKVLVGSSGSIDSGIFPGEAPAADSPRGAPKAERSSSRNSNNGGGGNGSSNECRFIETAEGWTIEYNEKCCEVREVMCVFVYSTILYESEDEFV